MLPFPGGLAPIAPDGRRVIVKTGVGAELWAVDPPQPLVTPLRLRIPVARSADGTLTAAQTGIGGDLDRGDLVLESSGRCTALGVSLATNWRHDTPAAFSPEGRFLFVAREGSSAYSDKSSSLDLFATDSGSLANAITVAEPVSIYLMPGVGRVGFAVEGGVRLFDAHSGQPWGVAEAPRLGEWGPPDSAGSSSRVRANHGHLVDAFTGPVSATSDGRYLIGQAGVADPVSVWDLTDRRHVLDLPISVPRAWVGPVTLSPDERWIAAGMGDTVLLWTRDGRPVPLAAQHSDEVRTLAFSPDGRWLASASRRSVVLVTETRTGSTVGEVDLVDDAAEFLWFTPDSRSLVIDTNRRFRMKVGIGRR